MNRILIVDDTESVRVTLKMALKVNDFEVIAASTVTEALRYIATETFDVLITDLHMPGAGDGFTVVSAMRHSQPAALTLVLSAFPHVQEAMAAIVLQADEILVKPLEIVTLVDLIKQRLSKPVSMKLRIAEPAADILERNVSTTVSAWYDRVMAEARITQIALSREERTAYLPMLLHELISRLRPPRKANSSASPAGVLQGTLRHTQGYTAHMLVIESRILQVSLFEVLHNNLSSVDFSLILLDVMAIADEVDFQLEQTMETYLEQRKRSEGEDIQSVA
jgi:DNA-binding response OmpR family regulator